MCDSFVFNSSKGLIFGKNSDREPNEVQTLEFHKGLEISNPPPSKCTYISVPEISKTQSILIGRPKGIWGAEYGINESGVSIGNEAVWTTEKINTEKNTLTGMDLVRLGLERASTARMAVDVITALINEFGQGGPSGYYDKKFTYHNSFLISDGKETWLLDTANKLWAAEKISGGTAISNCLSVGSNYKITHPKLVESNLKSFSRQYSNWFYSTFSGSKLRQKAGLELLNQSKTLTDAINWLKHHPKEPYSPSASLLSDSICAHAANPVTRNPAQTTGSFLVDYSQEQQVIWTTSSSSPCISVYKPINLMDIPEDITNLSKNLWLRHERLYRMILKDFKTASPIIREKSNKLQKEILQESKSVNPDSKFTIDCFERHGKLIDSLIKFFEDNPLKWKTNPVYRTYWKKQNKKFFQENPLI